MPTPPRPDSPSDPREFERARSKEVVRARLFGTRAAPAKVQRYEITRKVGEGGGGIVYAAFDPVVEREVALKRLVTPIADRETLLSEARALARVEHPAILTIYDVCEEGDVTYLVSALIVGGTLRDWLASAPPLAHRLEMCRRIGAGVRAAHAAGVAHRDLKPENVLIEAAPTSAAGDMSVQPRIADFGLAHSVTPARPRAVGPMGTPAYMAPEVAAGEPGSAASDQYSFCVMAIEILTDADPADIAEGRWLAPAGARAAVAALAVGLAPTPAGRYLDMAALLSALSAAPAAGATRSWTSGPPMLLVATSLFICLGVVGVGATWWVLSRPGRQRPAEPRERPAPATPPRAGPPANGSGGTGASSDESRLALMQANAMLMRQNYAGCVAHLETHAVDAMTRHTWASCADYGRDAEGLARACRAAVNDPNPNPACHPTYQAALAAEARGDVRECALLLLGEDDHMMWGPTRTRCIHAAGDTQLELRACVRQARIDGDRTSEARCTSLLRLQ